MGQVVLLVLITLHRGGCGQNCGESDYKIYEWPLKLHYDADVIILRHLANKCLIGRAGM